MFIELEEIGTLESVLKHELSRRLIYKHSDTCPISTRTFIQLEEFLLDYPDVDIYMLEVKYQRILSKDIEKLFEVSHQSPQVLLFKGNKLKDHQSHSSITKDWLFHYLWWGYNDKKK